MTSIILTSNNLAKHFWTATVNIACYNLNPYFLRPNTYQSSYEFMHEKRSNIKLRLVALALF